jgi:hypothetical protein
MTSRSPALLALRRAVVLISIGAVALTGVPATAGTTAATIDTYSDWSDGATIASFGHPDSSTYGQVITIPEGMHRVRWFTYFMSAGPISGTLTFRGEVYRWDGTKAARHITETEPMSLELTAGDPTFYPAKLRLSGARVKPGKQYVLFATISKDYEETDPNVSSVWPFRGTDVLPGGDAVFLNDSGDESQWTTVPWVTIAGNDMAFKAKLR